MYKGIHVRYQLILRDSPNVGEFKNELFVKFDGRPVFYHVLW